MKQKRRRTQNRRT